ncbi:unnamed protein product [Fusarium graminearum]|uniref:Zn(2)-C6 fungal-type domain-containing protein n=1 Tax=Gibberella zeae TaxID=5518 RepID=A0A9N8R9S0_GIBZA|nr:unnamed protein product [Fusarium graminearum]CAG1964372.1 unnamed protein product [Fusarium graminearum]
MSILPLCSKDRIRHLKCDEAKPTCDRCSKDKMKCDGYPPPKPPKPPRKRTKAKTASVKLVPIPLGTSIHDVPSLTSHECQYFQHFLQLTSTQLSLSAESTNFWIRFVLPLGHKHESIRYSVAAVGASHRLFMARANGHPNIGEIQNFMIQQYNKAISSILPNMTQSCTENLHVVLICCLLFISFEGLTGRYDEFIKHLRAGLALFNSKLPSSTFEDRMITEKLAEMFCRLQVESANFMPINEGASGVERWYRNNAIQGSQSVAPFNSLNEASLVLRQLDVLQDEKPWHYEGSDGVDKERLMTEASQRLQKSLDEWTARLDAFCNLRAEGLSAREEQQYDNLCLRQKYWQMVIDSYEGMSGKAGPSPKLFEPFLVAARKAASPIIALQQPTYSLEGDLISGLTFIASSAEDEEVKVQALDLLWRLNRREGLLDSRDVVEMHELSRALSQLTVTPTVDEHWKPKAPAGIPSIIERLRKYLEA